MRDRSSILIGLLLIVLAIVASGCAKNDKDEFGSSGDFQ